MASSFLVTFESKKVWWIRSAYVRKDLRSKGLFTKMFNRVVKNAQKNGIEMIKLYVIKSTRNTRYILVFFIENNFNIFCNEANFKSIKNNLC